MFKNCTPHTIRIQLPDRSIREYPPSGKIARVNTSEVPTDSIDGLPTVRRYLGQVYLPDNPEDYLNYLIVSSMVLEALLHLEDGRFLRCVAPDTGPTSIRYTEGPHKGQIFAVTRWIVG